MGGSITKKIIIHYILGSPSMIESNFHHILNPKQVSEAELYGLAQMQPIIMPQSPFTSSYGVFTSTNQQTIWHSMCCNWSGKCIFFFSTHQKKGSKTSRNNRMLYSLPQGYVNFPSVSYYIVHWDSYPPDQGFGKLQPGAKASLHFCAYELRMFFFFFHFNET